MAGNIVHPVPYSLRVRALGFVLASINLIPAVMSAQRVASATLDEPSVRDESSAMRRTLPRVSIHADNEPVRDVVEIIAKQAQLRTSYDIALIPVTIRVTAHLKDVPVMDAFARVLEGTGLAADLRPSGNVLIARRVSVMVQGTLIGKVVNAKTKQPVAGATVLIDDATKGVVTDNEGAFRLAATPGEHRVTVRAVGFVRQTKQVTVGESQRESMTFVLEPSASVLDEVVVTGTVVATERKAIPTPITVITADEIEKRGITRVDQLFRGEIPGVVSLELGSQTYNSTLGAMVTSRVYARGSSSANADNTNPIKTYIDGVELLDASYLGTLDPKSIERIEIITGPQASTIYGSGAIGGVMQIFTKKGLGRTTPELTLNLRYGVLQNNFSNGLTPQHNHSLLMSGGSGPEFTYSGNVSYNYTGQWQPNLFNRMTGAQVGANHVRGPITLNGSASITMGRNGTSGGGRNLCGGPVIGCGGAFTVDIEKKQTGQWIEDGWPVALYWRKLESTSSNQTLALNVDYRQFSWLQHHMTVGRSQNNFDLVPTSPFYVFNYLGDPDTLYKSTSSTGMRTTLAYNSTLAPPSIGIVSSNLTLGGNFTSGQQRQVDGCLASKTSNTFIPCQTYRPVAVTNPLDEDSWGGFANWRLGLFDALYLTLGLRAERSPNYGREHAVDWTPKNGLAYTGEIGELTYKLLGSYGRSTRAPLASQRLEVLNYVTGTNPGVFAAQLEAPALTPEYSSGPQGGVELYYGNIGSFTLNYYRQKVTSLIQRVLADSVPYTNINDGSTDYFRRYQYRNVADLVQEGWDFTGSTNIGPLNLKGAYSWNTNRVLKTRDPYSVSYVPPHFGSVTASYARGGTSVMWVTNYVGSTVQAWVQSSIIYNDNTLARLPMYVERRRWAFGAQWAKPGYTKSDMVMSHRLSSRVTANLNIVNVGNNADADLGELAPALGRQTVFGLSIR